MTRSSAALPAPASLNHQQKAVWNAAVNGGENVFITGGAGVGKSFLAKEIVSALEETGKDVMVCAPTGCAALVVGGATIHRAFGIKTGPAIEKVLPRHLPDGLRDGAVDAVVVDEVSMVRRDLLDAVAQAILLSSAIRSGNLGKPPVQLILVGDFAQLSPVLKRGDSEEGILFSHYGIGSTEGLFAFQSEYWDRLGLKTCELTEVVRQGDAGFSAALNAVRRGEWQGVDWIFRRQSKDPVDAVYLYGRKADVARENELQAIVSGESRCYDANVRGSAKTIAAFDKKRDYPTDRSLNLSVGAKVMFVSNDPKERWSNGTVGTVRGFKQKSTGKGKSRWEGARVFPVVELDGGMLVLVEPKTWEMVEYKADTSIDRETGEISSRLVENVVLSFTQIPLRLAYAMTIHKSQGATLSAANIDPDVWAAGQLYVALSRVSAVENIHFVKPPRRRNLRCSDAVKAFYGWEGGDGKG